MLGVPRAPSGLMTHQKDSQGSEAVLIMVTVYYRVRIQIKISKGERHMWQNPGETKHKLPAVASQWSCVRATPNNDG